MKRWVLMAVSIGIFVGGCSRLKPEASVAPQLKTIQDAIAGGSYDAAVSEAKAVEGQKPALACEPSVLYLEAYAMAYGWGDFQRAQMPLRKLLNFKIRGPLTVPSQRLLADCEYWQGDYARAMREYQRLTLLPDPDIQDYARLQIAGCLLLLNKMGDALTAYRSIVDQEAGRPAAGMAQLMVSNIYLEIQNPGQGKSELQKLLKITKNKAYQEDAKETLRQIATEAPFNKDSGEAK
ncbi:MAG: tetratricopeptide repeat protein [bacterium]